jgi:hypothetical protein
MNYKDYLEAYNTFMPLLEEMVYKSKNKEWIQVWEGITSLLNEKEPELLDHINRKMDDE